MCGQQMMMITAAAAAKFQMHLLIFTEKNCGFGTHIASLPFTTVYSYDQALQKEIAKEFIEHVYENDNTGKSFS